MSNDAAYAEQIEKEGAARQSRAKAKSMSLMAEMQ